MAARVPHAAATVPPAQLSAERNGVVEQVLAMLNGAEFGGQPVNSAQAQALIHQGEQVLAEAAQLAASASLRCGVNCRR